MSLTCFASKGGGEKHADQAVEVPGDPGGAYLADGYFGGIKKRRFDRSVHKTTKKNALISEIKL
jgi:hypothetical protein